MPGAAGKGIASVPSPDFRDPDPAGNGRVFIGGTRSPYRRRWPTFD
jgi:hypothetical protein